MTAPPRHRLTVRVPGRSSGTGVVVWRSSNDGFDTTSKSGTVDEGGTATFDGLTPGEYTISIETEAESDEPGTEEMNVTIPCEAVTFVGRRPDAQLVSYVYAKSRAMDAGLREGDVIVAAGQLDCAAASFQNELLLELLSLIHI